MIIDINQKRDFIDISYVNHNNQISNEEIFLENGFYKYVECDEYDPMRIKELISFHGRPVKKVPDKYFKHHNLNEYLSKDILIEQPELSKKLFNIAEPNPFSVDIEVPPTEKYGYSPPEKAENPIVSISFTDKNLNSLLFIIKNPKHPEINDLDKGYINNILRDSLGDFWDKYEYNFMVRTFDTEADMLNAFLENINDVFHLQMGWNFIGYDWEYIKTRCENIGINIKKASPANKLTRKKYGKKGEATTQVPTHRVILCYMELFQNSLIYNNLGSYSLNNIAEKILGLTKVSYNGNLRTLYESDYLRFVAYCFIDTILVMLIHHKTNLLSVDFFQSFYTNVPYLKITQTSISEALVYQELRDENIILLETEKTGNEYRKYQGGYVKSPLRKLVEAAFGIDYGALYPNSIITTGLSPEKKVDSILINDDMYPLNEIELKKWLKYKEMGYCLTPAGRIYNIKEEGLYPRIEKKLLTQRKIFKGHMEEIYLDLVPFIEAEIERREKNI